LPEPIGQSSIHVLKTRVHSPKIAGKLFHLVSYFFYKNWKWFMATTDWISDPKTTTAA